MQNITIGQAQRLTAPAPFGLLSVRKEDGSTNLMAVSWWTYLSNHPPSLGVCLSKKGLSGSLLEESGEFALSIVGESLREAALKCGGCSGRAHDKATEFGIPLEEADVIRRLSSRTEVGDHVFYIGEIAAIRGDASVSQLFAWDGYARLDPV